MKEAELKSKDYDLDSLRLSESHFGVVARSTSCNRSVIMEVPDFSYKIAINEEKINLGALVEQSDKKNNLSKETIAACRERTVHYQRKEGWMAERKRILTASETPAAINDPAEASEWYYDTRSPYKTRAALLKEKTTSATSRKNPNNAMKHGTKYESIAMNYLAENFGVKVLMWKLRSNGTRSNIGDPICSAVDFGFCTHPKYAYIGGSPDALTADGKLIEIKCQYNKKNKSKMRAGFVPLPHHVRTMLARC